AESDLSGDAGLIVDRAPARLARIGFAESHAAPPYVCCDSMIAPTCACRKGERRCRDDALMTKLPESVGIRKIIAETGRFAHAFVRNFTMKPDFGQRRAAPRWDKTFS